MLRLVLLVGLFSQCTAQTYNFSYKDPFTCDWIQCETNDNSILSVFQINTTNSNEYIDHAVPVDNCAYTQVLTPCDCPSVNQSYYTRVITSGTCSFTNNSKTDPVDCGCPTNTCTCGNGTAAEGDSCTEDGEICASCDTGYALNSDTKRCAATDTTADAVDCVGSWSQLGECTEESGVYRKTLIYNVTTPASNDGVECEFDDAATRSEVCTVGCGTLGYDNYNASVEVPIKERCTCGSGRGANDEFTGCESCDSAVAEYNDDDASAYNEKCATVSCEAGKHPVAATGFTGIFSDYTCTPCDVGQYSPEGSGQCSQCNGIVSTDGGTCTTCAVGNYINGNECKECSAGTYSNSANSGSCTDCPNGRYVNTAGSQICKLCPAGRYNDATGLTSAENCKACPIGTYSDSPGRQNAAACMSCPTGTYNDETGQTACKTCDSEYDLVGNTCIKQASAESITEKRTEIISSTASLTTQEQDTAIGKFDTLIRKTRDESKSQTATNNIRTVEITVTQEEKTNMNVLAKSGNGALVRRSLVEAAKSEVGSEEDAVVKMAKTDFEEMFITDVGGTTDAAAILVNVDSVEMRAVKPKGSELTCTDADIHMEDVASNTLSEVLLENVNDVSLKCLNNNFQTKLTLTSVEPDDVFKAECYVDTAWVTVNDALSHYDTYVCNERTHLVMSDTWFTAGCTATQYYDGTQCIDHTTCGAVGVRTPGNETHDTVCECIEVGQRVLMHDGTHKNVEHLVPGDVLRTPDGTTTVRGTRRGGRHLSSVHDVECAGRKGSITGNHAYHCEGEWRLPQDTHGPRALEGVTEVVAVETDNYCEDRMILESGLEVETWDGRGIDEWRPHTFENGRRLRCTLKGTWRDRVLQRVDSRQ